MATNNDVSQSPLLQLPPEIRNLIWSMVVRRENPVKFQRPRLVPGFAANKSIRYHPRDEAALESFRCPQPEYGVTGWIPPLSSTINSIFATNRQILREALAVFCSDNQFLIDDTHKALELLFPLHTWVPDPRLGPLIFWIPMGDKMKKWLWFLEHFKFGTAASSTSLGKLKLCFYMPKGPYYGEAMLQWKKAFFVAPTRWKVFTGVAQEVATPQDALGWPGIIPTPLGYLERTNKPVEGNLSFVRLAACFYETEVGFYDAMAHILP